MPLDAKMKGIRVVPATFDNEGEIKKGEHAVLTFEVPMDTQSARDQIAGLFSILTKEFVPLEVDRKQVLSE